MAGDRQPEPDRPAPSPLHPRALQEVWPAHVPAVRLLPRRRRVVGRHGEALPQDPRPGLHRPSSDGGRQVHHLQLRWPLLPALRCVLASGPQALPGGALQREAAHVARARPRRGGARHGERSARRGVGGGGRLFWWWWWWRPRGGGAQGAPLHGEPPRHLAHVAREEVHRRRVWLAGDA